MLDANDPMPPLVVTLRLAEPWQARFQALRDRYFPPARNRVPAHATLFHALPGDDPLAAMGAVGAAVREHGRRHGSAPVLVRVAEPYSLGGGVAFRLYSEPLAAIRAGIAAAFAARLTRQDAQPWRPHVTVQNKVPPTQARAALAELSVGFAPFEAWAAGIDVWRYEGGPWAPVGRVDLPAPSAFAGGAP